MEIIVLTTKEQVSSEIAKRLKEKIIVNPNIVLGLATGSTYIKVYNNLIHMNQKNEFSFKNVITFNLDEYVGLETNSPHSFRKFMENIFFNSIDINIDNTFFPCLNTLDEYDGNIKKHGSIDLQLLGIGENGHIAFNEPGTSFDSTTHHIKLSETTRESNSRFFDKMSDVPCFAVTMGIKTILDAKEIYLTAFGESKARVIQQMLEGEITEDLPASILQSHSNVKVFLDKEAAKYIKI